LNYTRGSRSG